MPLVDIQLLRSDPVRGYNFVVSLIDSGSLLNTVLTMVQPATAAGFSECSGLDTTLDVEDYKEGGNNGRVLKFPTRVTWANIRLKRGIAASDDLWQWHYDFAAGFGRRRDGLITLQDDRHQPVKVWTFTRGLPVKWVGPAMNAMQSQVAIEELEIMHEGLTLQSLGTPSGPALSSAFGPSGPFFGQG
jgi:phage tail-like protein